MPDLRDRPIDRLVADWEARARSPEAVVALRRLAQAEPALDRSDWRDLEDLLCWLRGARSCGEREEAAAVVRAMLRAADVHPLVPRAVLQAVVPGLVSVARRLSWGAGGDWEDPAAFFTDCVCTAWEVIVEWSGDDRAYPVLDVLSAVRCRLRRQLVRQRRARQQLVLGFEVASLPTVPWQRGQSDLDELARAIGDLEDAGADPGDTAVLYAHRVLGYSISELSRRTGRSRRHLGQRRDRAAHLLTA